MIVRIFEHVQWRWTLNDRLVRGYQHPAQELRGDRGQVTREVRVVGRAPQRVFDAPEVGAHGRIQRIVVEVALPLAVRCNLVRLEVLRVVAVLLDDRRVVLAPGASDSFSCL